MEFTCAFSCFAQSVYHKNSTMRFSGITIMEKYITFCNCDTLKSNPVLGKDW